MIMSRAYRFGTHRLTALGLVALMSIGCHQPISTGFEHPGNELAVLPQATAEQALQTMRERDAGVHAWRSQGTLIIEAPGDRVQLESIILADRINTDAPRMRMRATKIGRSVIDLVIDADNAWLWTRGEQAAVDARSEAALTRIPPLRASGFSFRLDRTTPDYFVFDTTWPGGPAKPAEAWVHRPTRTLHRLAFETPDGPTTLTMRYRLDGQTPLLDALLLTMPGQRSVLIRLRTFEVNPEFTDALFRPLPDSQRIER